MNHLRAVWLFFGIVWRKYPFDERIDAATAWEVAKGIWLT